MTHTVNSTSTDGRVASAAERELRDADSTTARCAEIEVAWSDPFGHAQGKRIPAAQFLESRSGHRIRLLRSVAGLEHRRHGRSTRCG